MDKNRTGAGVSNISRPEIRGWRKCLPVASRGLQKASEEVGEGSGLWRPLPQNRWVARVEKFENPSIQMLDFTGTQTTNPHH